MVMNWEKYLSTEASLRLRSVMVVPRDKEIISLAAGYPNPTCFPIKGLSLTFESPESNFKTLQTVSIDHIEGEASDSIVEMSQYMTLTGYSSFNSWVSGYINKYHKPNYSNWNYIVQAGATQSLDAVLRMLLDPNEDTVLAEQFTYSCFLETCKPLRLKVFGVKITDDGVDTNDMDYLLANWDQNDHTKRFKKPKLFYTMPTGHNPTGTSMTDKCRRELIKVCQKHDILIVEDDPYYHLQLDAKTPPSLLKYDTDGRVIRIDSFSKVLMPGLRVSVVTCNNLFFEKLGMSNEMTIHSAAAPSQLLLSTILSQWKDQGFEQWLAHLQGMYKERRNAMIDAINEFLPLDLISFNKPGFGMFIWFELKHEAWEKYDKSFTQAQWSKYLEDMIFDEAIKNKSALSKGHWFMVDQDTAVSAWRATYSYASFDEMRSAIKGFADAIKSIHASIYSE